MTITRAEAVQGLLSFYESPAYLEIGVAKGATFHSVRAARMVAVDPRFQFDTDAASAPGVEYHEVTSDVYFGEIASRRHRFDVIYLDGLHVFEQTLRDLTNALAFLAPDGVILIDDVYPASYLASLPDGKQYRALKRELEVTSKAWMGDVYRLVPFIESFFQQLSYRTIADNHGQLVVWRQRRPSVPSRSAEEIARLSYAEVAVDKSAFRFAPFAEILDEVRSVVAPGS